MPASALCGGVGDGVGGTWLLNTCSMPGPGLGARGEQKTGAHAATVPPEKTEAHTQ